MDSSSTPPGGSSPEQPGSPPWTPPSAPPTPPSGYDVSGGSARVEQPSYGPPPGQQYAPPPQGYPQQPQQPPQGAPTQPYGPPPQGYPPQPGAYQQPGYQQPQYAPPPQGYPPAGYQQPYAHAQAPVVVNKSGPRIPIWLSVTIGILVVFVLVCGGIVVATGMLVNSAGNAITSGLSTAAAGITAVGFTTDMEFGNYDEAYSYLGGNLAKNYSAATLKQKWEALAGNGTINTHLGDPKASGNQTKINWVITPPGKSSVTIELTMDEANNDWKIVDAKPNLIPNP
jgi:hypothetical protein